MVPAVRAQGINATSAARSETQLLHYRMAVVGLITLLVALVAIDARATYGARLSVDEPQYLLTAISLAEDLDLDVSDEIREDRFLPFHEHRSLNQQTIDLNEDGQRLSPHDPLLPLVLALPMKLGGWVGARLTMAVLGSLVAMLTLWTAVRRFDLPAGPAAVVIAALSASPPMIAYANQVYPAMASALCVIGGTALVTSQSPRVRAATAVPIVALPWLSVKYAPHAMVLALIMLWSLRQGRRLLAGVLSGLALMGIWYLVFHRRVYGGWTVYATGDHFVEGGGEWEVVGSKFNPVGRTRRVVGLIVDKNFGLAAWAPAYLFTPLSITWFAATKQRHRALVFSLIGVGWAMATWIALTMHGWWWPGRQLVPIMPLVIVVLTASVARSRWRVGALLATSVLAIGGWIWLAIESSTDRRTLIVDFFETDWPWYQLWREALPNMAGLSLSEPGLTLFWTVAFAGACAALWWHLRRRQLPHHHTTDTPEPTT